MYGVAGVAGVSAPRGIVSEGMGVAGALASCEGAAESLKGDGPWKSSREAEAMAAVGCA